MRPFPLRYAPWVARDLLLSQGIVLLLVAALMAIIVSRIDPVPPPEGARQIITAMMTQLGWPFVLYLCGGMVSTDRSQGFYRTYFSRPVSPTGYYLQRWLVAGCIMALVVPLLYAALGVVVGWAAFPWDQLARAVLLFVLLGALTFLASTLTRFDWLVALLIFTLVNILHQVRTEGVKLSPFWTFIYEILPPFPLLAQSAGPVAGWDLFHLLAYGVGMVAAALAVLHWRPLGVGGRA